MDRADPSGRRLRRAASGRAGRQRLQTSRGSRGHGWPRSGHDGPDVAAAVLLAVTAYGGSARQRAVRVAPGLRHLDYSESARAGRTVRDQARSFLTGGVVSSLGRASPLCCLDRPAARARGITAAAELDRTQRSPGTMSATSTATVFVPRTVTTPTDPTSANTSVHLRTRRGPERHRRRDLQPGIRARRGGYPAAPCRSSRHITDGY